MDVVVDVEGLRVVLEAETGFHRKAQAIKDADARLRQRLTTVVFAVCYPDGVTEDNLASATLTWTLRSKAGEPVADWSTGSVAQLAQTVQQAPRSLSGADVRLSYSPTAWTKWCKGSRLRSGSRWPGPLTCRPPIKGAARLADVSSLLVSRMPPPPSGTGWVSFPLTLSPQPSTSDEFKAFR